MDEMHDTPLLINLGIRYNVDLLAEMRARRSEEGQCHMKTRPGLRAYEFRMKLMAYGDK